MTENEINQIFQTWLKDHKALLFKIVRSYAFNEEDRDDLFQEIAIQVWKSVAGFKNQSAVTTWLYRVALNTAIKWTGKEKKHQEGHQSLDVGQHIIASQQPLDDRLVWLYEEIAQLNKVDRSLTLLLLDGFSYKEMSKILGISESNVGVKINRIKKHLTTKSKQS